MIQISTIGVYGSLRNSINRVIDINTEPTPQTSYEITKLIGDELINKDKLKSTIIRCGPIIFNKNNNNIISKLIRLARYKIKIKMSTLIYATHIEELIDAIDIVTKQKNMESIF